MTKGLLECFGTINLGQFWPAGESDADTVKVTLTDTDAFKFRTDPTAKPRVTHVFEGAIVKGKGQKHAIDAKNRVTIRLQGIDAPELHYRPVIPNLAGVSLTKEMHDAFKAANGNFRQNMGETATVEFARELGVETTEDISCAVRTRVDHPNDPFDAFGRLVGDIFVVGNARNELNINKWLCANGWAFPTFYNSMLNEEIADLSAAADAARAGRSGLWATATDDLSEFDRELQFRNHGSPDPAGDVGPVIVPKLFRRRSTFGVALEAGIVDEGFKAYLKREPDACFETQDFLAAHENAQRRALDEFVSKQTKFLAQAKDLVFVEHQSLLVDADGKPKNHW
jgi:endonuclease YncB( thermonuclease family)